MATFAAVSVLDGGLDALAASAVRLLLLKAYSSGDSYATVIGNAICEVTIDSSYFSLSGTDSQILTFAGAVGASSADSGVTPDLHFAFTDGASTVLWVTDETSNVEVLTGKSITFPSLMYEQAVETILAPDFTLQSLPLYFAHAGNKLMWPEESYASFAGTVAAGEIILDIDSQVLSTGEVVLMHDTTVDRTTSGTGNVSSKTLTDWQALRLDPSTWFGGGYPDTEAPPILSTVLSMYISSALFSIENKASGAIGALISQLTASGIAPNQALISSFISGDMSAINTAGYLSMFLTTTGVESAATVAGYGVDWVGVGTGTSSAQVTAYKAAGLKVGVWTVNRQNERDTWLGYGVDGIFSDDTKYLRSATALRMTDNFASQTWEHGMLSFDDSLGTARGSFSSPDYWGYSFTDSGYRGCLMGFLCPVAAPDNFTLDLKITFTSALATDRWAAVFLGTTDQAYKNDAGTNVGYHVLFRKNGNVEIWSKPSGSAGSLLASQAGSTITDGSEKIFRITVTPTQIKAAQIDSGGVDITATSTTNSYSLPYISLGRAGLSCKFRDLAVT